MAAVETWQGDHERRCDERQKSLGREIGELKETTRSLTKGAWGVLIGLLAFTAVQLYGYLQRDAAAARAAPPAAVSAAR